MKYANIQINFSYLDPQLEDVIGEANYEYCERSTHVIANHFEEGEEPYFIQDAIENAKEGALVHSDADAFILSMNLLQEYEDQTFTINVQYSHIIWLFHDLSHVRFDATSEDIYVDEFMESRAIKNSIRLCIENEVDIPWDILGSVEREFLIRFNSNLDLASLREELGISFGDTDNYTFKVLQ